MDDRVVQVHVDLPDDTGFKMSQRYRSVVGVTGNGTDERNSPHIYCPSPLGVGGIGDKEDWVWDNFGRDPFAKKSMTQTAENMATKAGIDRAAQTMGPLMRYEQYQDALEDDSAFLKRYLMMALPPSLRAISNPQHWHFR